MADSASAPVVTLAAQSPVKQRTARSARTKHGDRLSREGSSSHSPVLARKMSRSARRAEAKARARFVKGAMPTPVRSPEEMQELYVRAQRAVAATSPHHRPRSPATECADSSEVSSTAQFPWEMKINAPPPKHKTPPVVDGALNASKLSPEQQAKMEAAAAARDAAKQAAQDAAAQKAALAKAKLEEAARKRAVVEAQEQEILDAASAAKQAALSSEPKKVEELNKIISERKAETEELTKALSAVKAAKHETLKRQLGEAIIVRGITTAELMKEWDKNGVYRTPHMKLQ